MGRRRKGRDIHGVLLLDKPAGLSSNQAVQRVRWLLKARKAGHTGTLDPFATGMLPICLGEASKTAAFMLDATKTYEARARLGIATDTGDIEGAVTREESLPDLDAKRIDAVLETFLGTVEQVPPMYSALKKDGRPLYELARKGLEVEREPRTVAILELGRMDWSPPDLQFRVHCSKGTYVRTLAEDIARKLGSCAHLRALRRTGSGVFSGPMVTMESLESHVGDGDADALLLPPDAGLSDWPTVTLDAGAATLFSHGNPVETAVGRDGMVRVHGPGQKLLGLGEFTGRKLLKPRRIMNL